MEKLRCKRTDVDKYLPNYFLSGDDIHDETPVYQYLVAVGCILVVCLTLFMGTITWSRDRVAPQLSQGASIDQGVDFQWNDQIIH